MKYRILKESIEFRQSDVDAPHTIVLAELKDSTAAYVTWFHNLQTGGFSNGHYFGSLRAAEKDFETRTEREWRDARATGRVNPLTRKEVAATLRRAKWHKKHNVKRDFTEGYISGSLDSIWSHASRRVATRGINRYARSLFEKATRRNPREEKRLIYTARELRDMLPEAFERARKEYADDLTDIPWQDEIVESLKAIFKASGIRLTDWSIGAYSRSYVRFDMGDAGNLSGKRAFAWLENNLLGQYRLSYTSDRRKRYGMKPGQVKSCPLTGYYVDDDLIAALIQSIKDGDTLKEAYASLADVISKILEKEYEYHTSVEGFLDTAEANGYEYDERGNRV